jgi:hypothetical protein
MAEPTFSSPDGIPTPRAPGNPADGVIAMRAATGADIAHARVLLEQALITLPFLRVEPYRAALIRGLLTRASVDVTRAAAALGDETFRPSDGDEAA